jgi:hypothetical protein
MKKEWKKPQMVVVARSTEECVLIGCKDPGTQGTPIVSNFSCTVDECAECNSHTSS